MAGAVKKISIFLIVIASGLVNFGPTFAQQNTNLNFELCGSETPQLAISSPQSDSVTNSPEITISGTASHTTQIEVFVNGNFDQSVAIGQDTDDFNTNVTLQQGTNSIRLAAYYSCNGTSNSTSIVVTYQPGTTSSEGSQISTVAAVSGDENLPNVSNPILSDEPSQPQTLSERISENLGLGADINESIVRPIGSWAALIVSLSSAFIALSPVYLSAKLLDFLGLKRLSDLSKSSRIVIRLLLGIVSLLLAFFLQA